MYTDHQIPRELERYIAEARKMRSEHLAGLLRGAFNAVARVLRGAAPKSTPAKAAARGTLAPR